MELSGRIAFLEQKFQQDMKELERQFKKDCGPLQQLKEKKQELEKIREKLAEAGYEEENEASEAEETRLSESAASKSFAKQRMTPSNPPKRSKKKSVSPLKGISKTENDFYNKSRLTKKSSQKRAIEGRA